uniref:non-reducing end alpha-L-arabinofuranosidase n=1 Tax=Oryza rufipogon TaxID=4529 RepID=A0A0E0R3R3_ORYRU
MASRESFMSTIFFFLLLFSLGCKCIASELHLHATQTAVLKVDASPQLARQIPDTLFGIFFEEINHAGAGGIWAELVSNRGFEAGGPHTPSNIDPWSIIGDDSSIFVATDRTSCFSRNTVALRMEVLCDNCPAGGVGIYNPGFWGMNIEDGKIYNLVMYVKSPETVELTVSLTSSDGSQNLASTTIPLVPFLSILGQENKDVCPFPLVLKGLYCCRVSGASNWTKLEQKLVAQGTNRTSRLQITTNKKGVVWFDQVSLMPADTYKGHGFRTELISMMLDLKPRFLRFPGGCFVEGEWLRNAFRWRESIGPWEERPGHFGDVWHYWTDDGLGYYEFLQLSEDLGAAPIWVFNNGISHNDEVDTAAIAPFVKDVLDSLEFARGNADSTWGSVRAAMGHPEPFPVKYVAIGNEDCGKKFYRGNYLKFYNAIREAYPDIQMISNCDASSSPLDHPADLYDFHVYTDSKTLFSMKNTFDRSSRNGPKAFVSEYAVWRSDAAFLTGLEKNSDVVQMASYAPLFVNNNDQTWNPDAIVFNSWQQYGTPSYWMQTLFGESSGAMFHPVTITSSYSGSLAASAITWQDSENSFLRVKIINFGSDPVSLTISATGLQARVNALGSTATVLTSSNVMDENSFSNPNKVVPVKSQLSNAAEQMQVTLAPHSFSSFDLALAQSKLVAEMSMLSRQAIVVVVVFLVLFFVGGGSRCEAETLETASLHVDYSVARRMPDTLFGLFFEEINHAGSGGLWAELVSNRGFEAGANTSNIDPWSIIGDESSVHVVCDDCPAGGVGIYNPGFWGMIIRIGGVDGFTHMLKWIAKSGIKFCSLLAHGTCRTSRLELTTRRRGVIWLDQVSLMPSETYKGHGFRQELMYMLLDLKPRFLRFPGGCFVEGNWLKNAFRWKETIGPWEERPGHYGDVWHYWTDDGLGYYDFLQDAIDSLEFARGSKESTWGSVRAAMGHPEPFPLKYVALGNEDCEIFKPTYQGGDAGNGSLLASLAEAAFLTGLEKNSDVIQMASYAPLFVNENDRTWNPDAIVFNSWQQYGTPSYWMQTYFRESSGSVIHPVTISSSYFDLLAASAITWQDNEDIFLRVKIVNFGPSAVNLTISSSGLQAGVNAAKSTVTVLTSSNLLDENSFSEPNKVVPVTRELPNAGQEMQFLLLPFSLTSFDLAMF